jgi:hypothetical protein
MVLNNSMMEFQSVIIKQKVGTKTAKSMAVEQAEDIIKTKETTISMAIIAIIM